jgi:hypothetical protein
MDSTYAIPAQVAQAILANRRHFHTLDAMAKAKNSNLGFVTKPPELSTELRFWQILDDEALDDFLNEDLLSALYENENLDWKTMPVGYEPLLRVLEFERHCAFEGWTAVSNKGEGEMTRILNAYSSLDMHEEAAALNAVVAAYVELSNNDHPEFHDILAKAYRSVPNSTGDEYSRASFVRAYVRNNPHLFWSSTDA